MRYVPLACTLLLAACEQTPDEVVPAQQVGPSALVTTAAEPQRTSLAGSWRVTELDGAPLESFLPLELYANSRLIYWEPTCAGMERRYVIEGREFSASEIPSDGPRIVCEIGLPERIVDVFVAIDEADRIQFTDGGGALLSGLRRSVLLMPI